MKALRFYAPEDVRLEDVPEPDCGPREVKIKVRNCSTCGTDVKIRKNGHVNITGTTTMGHEVAGEVILTSEAVLIGRGPAAQHPGVEVFLRRLQGVLVARSYVMMDYDLPADRTEEALALTPGIESPTVAPLHKEGWVAVRSMVPRAQAQRIMDALYEIGARAILTTDIHASRL